jgi:hypothetical protein
VWILDSSLRQLFSGVPPSFSRSIKSLLLIRCSLLAASLVLLQVHDFLVLWSVMVELERSLRKDVMFGNYEMISIQYENL